MRVSAEGFNPHTHEGCDIHVNFFNLYRYVSIHTPTKGVTGNNPVSPTPEQVSIHTPTKGVTEYKTSFDRYNGVSIHTPTKGVTKSLPPVSGLLVCFNPHTHEGCDYG